MGTRDGSSSHWLFSPRHTEPKGYRYWPPRESGESVGGYLFRVVQRERKLPRVVPLETWYAKKWGLKRRMHDPDTVDEVRFLDVTELTGFPDFPAREDVEEYFEFVDGEAYKRVDRILVGFDLTLPLSPQLKLAKKELRRRLVRPARNRQDMWVDYLRVLDARDPRIKEETFSDIADILCRDSDNAEQLAQQKHAAAKKMIQKKRYLNILLRPIDPKI